MALAIPEGDPGVEATVRWIRKLVDCAVRDPTVNRLAISILDSARAREHDQLAAAKAIYNWVRANFRFVPDVIGYDDNWNPVGYETLRPVEEILRVRAGDCDDINGVLLPSLLGSVGIAVRLVTVAADPDRPGAFSHIYPEALIDGQWIAVDAARPGARFGREPERYERKRVWGLSDGGYQDVGRLNGLGFELAADAGGDSGGGIDWGAIIKESIQTAPKIIGAARAAPGSIPFMNLGPPASPSMPPAGYGTSAVNTSTLMGMSSGTIILAVGGLFAAFLLMGMGRK